MQQAFFAKRYVVAAVKKVVAKLETEDVSWDQFLETANELRLLFSNDGVEGLALINDEALKLPALKDLT